MVTGTAAKSYWKKKGNKLIVGTTDGSMPEAIYDLQFTGNKMIWTFHFADNPSMPNPGGKTKTTIITYERL